MEKLKNYTNIFLSFIYKYRYIIALIIFILCIIFEINGSSIGMWTTYVNDEIEDNGILFGKSREIRSDEWAVFMPMIFSQKFDGFNYISNLIRGGNTDVFIVYGLPVLNIMQIYRPFQIGFLILGLSKGLSFYWIGRFLALLLVSFEFGMIYTKKNKNLAFIYSILITLSPIVQWWFAINGIAELFIFGELALILLYNYIINNNLKYRILYLIGMIICAGGYVLIFYPAWQIPMFFVFLIMAICIIIENKDKIKINTKDILLILISLCIFIISMLYIWHMSKDTIKSILNTDYPGERISTGGEYGSSFFKYVFGIFLPFKDTGLSKNICSTAKMFGLFPLGIIISIYVIIKNKNKDKYLISMLFLYFILSIYCIIGFPEILAKITLLSFSKPSRVFLVLGFLDVLLLIRSIELIDFKLNSLKVLLISGVISAILVLATKLSERQYITIKMAAFMCLMCTYLFYYVFNYKNGKSKYFFTAGITLVMIISGLTVNPIRRGIDVIYKSPIIESVQNINSSEGGKWIVEEMPFPYHNYLLMAGVPVINSINVYPNNELWKKFDEDEIYKEIYNRYAHIRIKLYKDNNEYENKFDLLGTDSFSINIVPEDLKKMDVKYIFSSNNYLEELETEEVDFETILDKNGYYIYKVNYKEI